MSKKQVPVYLFTGFMDSGKTTLINETLYENEFGQDNNCNLIIACEDGDEEFDEAKLATVRGKLAMIEDKEGFTADALKALDKQYSPDAVFLEYNGTWESALIFETEWPEGWEIVQILATVDATTFENYLANMRVMMTEQLFKADVVIFNRCDDNTPKAKFRSNIKAMNRPAQIVYERADGTIDEREEEMPFDINADVIEITDADYAIWFMDCMEKPKKYDGKKVHFLGLVYNPADGKLRKDVFVPGRFAMTCCADDIQFLGMMCKSPDAKSMVHKSWIDITARIKCEFCKEYKGKGPVLYPEDIKVVPEPEKDDQLVYFS